MTDMKPAAEAGRTRITLECPTRGLLGYRNVFFTDTKVRHCAFVGSRSAGAVKRLGL